MDNIEKNTDQERIRVYIPIDAEINIGNVLQEPPKTEYNDKQVVFKREFVEKGFGIKDIKYE
jgi:hypothetical protein